MNWLAHLRLAPKAPLLRLGNLCGDFVRGVDLGSLHPELQRGIAQHRAIDGFVDGHAVVRKSRERLDPGFQRFSGVLIDVFYDHFLARDWRQLGEGGTLTEFAAMVHRLLDTHAALLPARLQEAAPWMRRQAWLPAYADVDGIDAVLKALSQRVKRTTPLERGAGQLLALYGELERDFAAFWPELAVFAATLHES